MPIPDRLRVSVLTDAQLERLTAETTVRMNELVEVLEECLEEKQRRQLEAWLSPPALEFMAAAEPAIAVMDAAE